jgi:hypothetical protein
MTKEQSVGTGFIDAVHSDDLPLLLSTWNSQRKQGNESSIEARYRRHDGVYKWMLVRASPYKNEQGEILKWYGTNTDIHDLVMDRIDAARHKLQILTVLAHAEINVFSVNQDRIVTMAEGGMLVKSADGNHDIFQKDYFFGKDIIALAKSMQPGGIPRKYSIFTEIRF